MYCVMQASTPSLYRHYDMPLRYAIYTLPPQLQVMLISQFLLLQTTPPPALIRLNKTKLEYQYKRLTHLYQSQHHGSIDDFLNHHLAHDTSRGGLLMQVCHDTVIANQCLNFLHVNR